MKYLGEINFNLYFIGECMDIFKKVKLLNFLTFGLITSLYLCITAAFYYQEQLKNSYETQFISQQLAVGLKQESAGLTRSARTFVVTGDSSYEKEYFDILAVRNGEKERPDGRKISGKQLMVDAGFTEEEFALLSDAEKRSNDLVQTETIAMNAAKGLFRDANGEFTVKGEPDLVLGRKLMHDESYHKNIAYIGEPISAFEKAMVKRTNASVEQATTYAKLALGAVAIMIIGMSFTMYLSSNTLRSAVRMQAEALTHAYSKIRTSVANLTDTSNELSTASAESASSLQETASSLEELTAMVQKNAEHAKATSQTAKQSEGSAHNGKQAMQEMVDAIKEINSSNDTIISQINQSNQEISSIVRVIAEIGEKTKVINDIVFQTKLLSFNASVEAARAGENGKGFAVVAEEVGSLATMSGNAAKEISDLLDSSISKVEGIVNMTREKVDGLFLEGKKKVDHGTHIAHQCESILDEIVHSVSSMTQMANEIAIACNEQSMGISEINKAMSQLDEVTHANANSSSSISTASSELNKTTIELNTTIENLGHLTGAQSASGNNVHGIQQDSLKIVHQRDAS